MDKWLHLLNFIFFLLGVSHRHLSDHMSELVENTLSDLEQSKAREFFLSTTTTNTSKPKNRAPLY